jgi:hypothetical protein
MLPIGSSNRLVIEPVEPFQGGVLDRIDVPPWTAAADDLKSTPLNE